MTNAKAEILSRIRAALGSDETTAAPTAVPREYRSAGEHAPGSDVVLELLVDRLEDYKAHVHRTTATDLPGVLAQVLAERSAERQVIGSSNYRSPDVLPTT